MSIKALYMKPVLIFFFMLLSAHVAHTQSLAGEWKGNLVSPADPFESLSSQNKLFFVLTKDSSYKIYSYCKGRDGKGNDTIIVAKVKYKMISEDFIYLEETEVLKPLTTLNNCLVKMHLKIVKKKEETVLEGTWSGVECIMSGTVVFKRK